MEEYGDWECGEGTLHSHNEGCNCPDSSDLYKFMASKNFNLPAHNFYALEVSRALGLGDTGAIRAGLAPYSTKDDVDRLISGLEEYLAKK